MPAIDTATPRNVSTSQRKPSNAAELMHVADVDGALVGGASLEADEFLAIAGVYR